jgi:hypothetical protein
MGALYRKVVIDITTTGQAGPANVNVFEEPTWTFDRHNVIPRAG